MDSGVDAYEMGFAFGIPDTIPDDVKELAKANDFILSCHLPLWINLSGPDIDRNVKYLLQGLKIADELGSIAVFHMGFYNGLSWRKIRDRAASAIRRALEAFDGRGFLGVETTGRQKALGTLDEVLDIVKLVDDERFVPVIDWAHVYARNSGAYPKSYGDFRRNT